MRVVRQDMVTGDIQVILVSFYSHMDAQVYYLSNFFTKVSNFWLFRHYHLPSSVLIFWLLQVVRSSYDAVVWPHGTGLNVKIRNRNWLKTSLNVSRI